MGKLYQADLVSCTYMSRFVHLHTHSHYSFLEALPKVDELVDAAMAKGMTAVGLTDTGNMHGAIEFYKAAEKRGVKPILGVDLYMAPRFRFDKDPIHDAKRSRIVLLAENNEGYKNLLALVSAAHIEGFMEKPRIDRELLRKHKDGLIAILPSFAGDVAKLLAAGDSDGAEAALAEYMIIMGPDNLFLELSHHPKVPGHMERMEKLIVIGARAKVPLVAQHDVYYINPDDREPTEVLRRIKYGSGGDAGNEDEDFSFVGIEDIDRWFGHLPRSAAGRGVQEPWGGTACEGVRRA
jgi:DNA polymerase III subunit alpha